MNEIDGALNAVAEACRRCGRDVIDVKYNGEVVSIRRETEAISLFVGKIQTKRDLQYAAKSVTSAILGC